MRLSFVLVRPLFMAHNGKKQGDEVARAIQIVR